VKPTIISAHDGTVTAVFDLVSQGDNMLESVSGSIAPGARGLLLGQSFLRRLKSWSIDNQNQALMLH
jgi:hypothetical protein